jgi:hypothetical protein
VSPKAKPAKAPKAAKAAKAATEDDASLKRLPGVGWQTRDGRFTIETASGTWSVTDAEQSDDLGLPLVRGPFRSLTEAKAAIDTARSSGPATSSLTATGRTAATQKPAAARPEVPAKRSKPRPRPDEPAESRWISELDAGDRRRARQLLRRLEEAGARDVEGIVRRDLVGDVPTVARFAIARQLADALGDADPAAATATTRLLNVLVDGRDEDLEVRWRLVDGAGRPIGATADDVVSALKHAKGDG